MNAPNSKTKHFFREKAGEFGNRQTVWMNRDLLEASGYRGLVCVRYYEPSSPFCRYNVPYEDVDGVIEEFEAQGAEFDKFFFNEMCPDDKILLQGEVVECPELHLHYSTWKEPMRKALAKEPRWARGAAVRAIIDHVCWPKSADMIWDLLDKYPGAAIEFSVYRVALGCLPGHNTVIWEVRDY